MAEREEDGGRVDAVGGEALQDADAGDGLPLLLVVVPGEGLHFVEGGGDQKGEEGGGARGLEGSGEEQEEGGEEAAEEAVGTGVADDEDLQ